MRYLEQIREIVVVCTERVGLRDGDCENLVSVRRVRFFVAILHINFNLTVID
jgi:hypothetical protein